IRAFLFENMYRAPDVVKQRKQAAQIILDLFGFYMSDPTLLPQSWQDDIAMAQTDAALARHVADYIAGMTDRFALQQHQRLVEG
ncbi:MAG: deoxyguanosinetriphosphate triphosphohydrolase, partial [Pseudomonadota bacterium]